MQIWEEIKNQTWIFKKCKTISKIYNVYLIRRPEEQKETIEKILYNNETFPKVMTYTKSKTKKAQAKNQKTVPRYIMFKVQKTKE